MKPEGSYRSCNVSIGATPVRAWTPASYQRNGRAGVGHGHAFCKASAISDEAAKCQSCGLRCRYCVTTATSCPLRTEDGEHHRYPPSIAPAVSGLPKLDPTSHAASATPKIYAVHSPELTGRVHRLKSRLPSKNPPARTPPAKLHAMASPSKSVQFIIRILPRESPSRSGKQELEL